MLSEIVIHLVLVSRSWWWYRGDPAAMINRGCARPGHSESLCTVISATYSSNEQGYEPCIRLWCCPPRTRSWGCGIRRSRLSSARRRRCCSHRSTPSCSAPPQPSPNPTAPALLSPPSSSTPLILSLTHTQNRNAINLGFSVFWVNIKR